MVDAREVLKRMVHFILHPFFIIGLESDTMILVTIILTTIIGNVNKSGRFLKDFKSDLICTVQADLYGTGCTCTL